MKIGLEAVLHYYNQELELVLYQMQIYVLLNQDTLLVRTMKMEYGGILDH